MERMLKQFYDVDCRLFRNVNQYFEAEILEFLFPEYHSLWWSDIHHLNSFIVAYHWNSRNKNSCLS